MLKNVLNTRNGKHIWTFALALVFPLFMFSQIRDYTIYYENFDATNGSWVASTGSTTNFVRGTGLSAAGELGEGNYWYTNNYNNYSNNTYTTVESPIISTIGYNNLVFSADVRYNCNSDSDDGMAVQYRKRTSGVWSSWTILGANGLGSNWYDGSGNVNAISPGSDGWTGDSTTSQAIRNYFNTATIPLPITLENEAEIQFRFVFASDSSTTDDGVAFDNIIIYADPIIPFSDPVIGPGSINSNLKLWLKATSEIGIISNNTDIATWNDQAFDNNAISLSTNAPSFRNNTTDNINFNPVINFTRANSDYMRGKGGYFSQDYFVVIKSNGTIDNSGTNRQVPIAGRAADISPQVDGTGLGLGSISARFSNEVVAHMKSSVPQSPNTSSYGRAFTSTTTSYTDEVIIYNVKTNAAGTQTEIYKNGVRIDNTAGQAYNSGSYTGNLNFSDFLNQQYYLGVGRFSLNGNVGAYVDGNITEIISYKTKNSVLNQQKIQSYLALKNGITLHASNSITVDRLNDVNYIDSNGVIIWDTSTNTGYNYDIAGIGRDDNAELNQKQSKSVNVTSDITGPTNGILTIGLTNISNTNSDNTASFPIDREYLVWGNNGEDINLAATVISVNMSAGITPALNTDVFFTGMKRVWKVIENGGDVPKVKVSIPKSAVRNITPPGSYLMFISSTGNFDPTSDYRVMTESGGNLYADYDFDGTKYITFGYAPETKVVRSIYFDGLVDYVDMEDALNLNSTQFTISAWIKRDPASVNASIVSKRDAAYTQGYDFRINGTGHLEMSWKNGTTQTITSNTIIPGNSWHQVAVIYNGSTANLYIDGVLDISASLSAPVATTESFYIAAAGKITSNSYFKGNIDEVRVWDVALSENQMRYIMNQEIVNNASFVGGLIIPSAITNNEVASIPWSKLAGYYPMSVYTYTNTNDESGNGHQGALRNLDTVDRQTAPLPYESQADGSWNTPGTWLNNTVQDLPNSFSIKDGVTPIDWNIVQTSHNIISGDRDITVLGLISTAGKLTIAKPLPTLQDETNSGHELRVTHYLELDGNIDLVGESQLVQDEMSTLDQDSGGYLERDQQGTANSFNYNYWSSSVGPITAGGVGTRGTGIASTNASSTIAGVLKDGTDATIPDKNGQISFNPSYTWADSGITSPIKLSSYWMYTFNGTNDDYNSWNPINETTSLLPGEGYTLKGTSGAVPITNNQNYVYRGKPYNGDFYLPIVAGNDRLIGNPYPSSLDATVFIKDNISIGDGGTNTSGNIFNGAVYFWDHFGEENSHNLGAYVGGYATRNLIGGAPAISDDARINANGATGSKIPGQYIPVNQGFFVITSVDVALTGLLTVSGGNILFKNSQRAFMREGVGNSVFMKNSNTKNKATANKINLDTRPKIRLTFDSPLGYHRQILVGVDENATNNFDIGYDAPIADINSEDMYWFFNGSEFVIQGVNNFNTNQELPLGLTISETGLVTIKIDSLENVDQSVEIYIKDNFTGLSHQINNQPFEINLPVGEYKDRFALTFKPQKALTVEEDVLAEGIQVFMNNTISELQIKRNIKTEIKSINLYNNLGQSIRYWNNNFDKNNFSLPLKASTGLYFVQINTTKGNITKKIIIK